MKRQHAGIFKTARAGLQPAHGSGSPHNRRDGPTPQTGPQSGGSRAHPLQATSPARPTRSPKSSPATRNSRGTDPASAALSP